MQSLAATRVSAKVSLDGGKLQISELNADFLGGKHRGEWQADFSVKPAVCSGSGSLTGISLAGLADAMKDAWDRGYCERELRSEGTVPGGVLESAEGTLQFDMKDGTLPHVALGEDAEPLEGHALRGAGAAARGKIEMKDARLDSPGGKFQLSGTASLKGELDLKLAKIPAGTTAAGYTIGGTLAEPRVVRLGAETQAQLKPDFFALGLGHSCEFPRLAP